MAMDASVSARGWLYNRFEAADLGFWKQEVVETRHLSLDGGSQKSGLHMLASATDPQCREFSVDEKRPN